MPELADLIQPGMRVLLGDGLGVPRTIFGELPSNIRLVVGWLPQSEPTLDFARFDDVRVLMSGWGVRRAVDAGLAHYVAGRLAAVPAAINGPLRPDLLVINVVPTDGGYALSTEASYIRAALDSSVPVAAVLTSGPRAEAGPAIPADRVSIVGRAEEPARTMSFSPPNDDHRALAEQVARLVPAGARVHVGPGAFGQAVQEAINVPVHLDTGLLGDGLLDLDRRGLLLGTPVATYLAGGTDLLDWADGRGVIHRIEYTHDPSRLARGLPFISINTAIEIDDQAQVNVEGTADSAVGGIGGHPDYSAAAAASVDGLSIIAVTAEHGGAPTLVERLSCPVTTPSHDVDVLVTDRGSADLRGLDRNERAAAVRALWRYPGSPRS